MVKGRKGEPPARSHQETQPVAAKKGPSITDDRIFSAILAIRGEKVLLDATLAVLYGVETRALVQAVKRNLERFPDDFMARVRELEITECDVK
jgi:hypothetical protein